MNHTKSRNLKRILGVVRKAVVFLLVTAILAPYFYFGDIFACEELGDLIIEKSVEKEHDIAGGGSHVNPNYEMIFDGDEISHTNVLRYSYTITNTNPTDPVIVNLKTEMPSNAILFFDKEYHETNDGRTLSGPAPSGGTITDTYTEVCYTWTLDADRTLYKMSIAASVDSGTLKPDQFTLTIDGVTIAPDDFFTFEYAVIVYLDGSATYGTVSDNFYIKNVTASDADYTPTDSLNLYAFKPSLELTADQSGSVAIGGEVEYTLTMKSIGTTADVELHIPDGTSYKSGSLTTAGLTLDDAPYIASDKISFTLTDLPPEGEFSVSYTVKVNVGATYIHNDKTSVTGGAFGSAPFPLAPINLTINSDTSVVAYGYNSNRSPSNGLVAGQKITYSVFINSDDGSALTSSDTLEIPIPVGAAFVSAIGIFGGDNGADSNGTHIVFDLDGLGSSAYEEIFFTLKLNDNASGDLCVNIPGLGQPSAWEHPILVVTKRLEKNVAVADDNAGYLANTSIPDGATVENKNLIRFIYTVTNTGSIPVSGVDLSAPVPDNMALYITRYSADAVFAVVGYGATGVTMYWQDNPLDYSYGDLTFSWNGMPGSDYERSIAAIENTDGVWDAYYGPFTVYKNNLSLAPYDDAGDTLDFRYAAFVNTTEEGVELNDNFTVNGASTAPVRLYTPTATTTCDYTISSYPLSGTSVKVGDEITYTFTIFTQVATSFEADIPYGTIIKADSETTGEIEGGRTVTHSVSNDTRKIQFGITPGIGDKPASVSYTVIVTAPMDVYVNNVNVSNDNITININPQGIYLGSISHNKYSAETLDRLVLGYTFMSSRNETYIQHEQSLTFKFYMQNNTNEALENIVMTIPIDPNFRLDPGTIAYWFGEHALIIDGSHKEWDPYYLLTLYYNKSDDFASYDALGPFSIQYTVPYLGAHQALTALGNAQNPAAEFGFSGNIKEEDRVPANTRTIEVNASLTANSQTVSAPTLTYFFQPTPFVEMSYYPLDSTTLAYGQQIDYTVTVLSDEVTLEGESKLFISGIIPAGSTLVTDSVEVFGKDGYLLTEVSDYTDTSHPGKVRINIPDPEQHDYTLNYRVTVTSYTGILESYAVAQVFRPNTEPNYDKVAHYASETPILAHPFNTLRSTVTISQSLVDTDGVTTLTSIPQRIGDQFSAQPVEFVITFADSLGNEYNAVMKNTDPAIIFHGLPYGVQLTVSEIGTSDTVFVGISDSGGLPLDNNTFTLCNTPEGRNISITVVSKYQPNGGFSSAVSRNNRFEIPNYDFTSLLRFQLQDLAAMQLDNGSGDGAIPIADDNFGLSLNFANQRFSIRPYFAMTAANAFLLDPDYHDNAKRYIKWHIAHLNTDPDGDVYGTRGSIYDYDYSLTGGERRAPMRSEGDGSVDVYDSTDSYAALFFDLLLNYYEATDDASLINKETLDLVLLCLQDSFSSRTLGTNLDDPLLTVAIPVQYEMEFLMDNAEVYRGFLRLEQLYDLIKEDDSAAIAAGYAHRIWLGIQNLLFHHDYQGQTHYDYAFIGHGSAATNIDTYFYPDAIAQLFPIIFDVIPATGDRAITLYNDFCRNFPSWTDMRGYTGNTSDPPNGNSDFPNVLIILAAVKMGDLDRATQSFKNIETLYRQTGNEHPFLCFESGETALAIARYMNAYYAKNKAVFTAVPKFQGSYTP